jgi:hypothetical protein
MLFPGIDFAMLSDNLVLRVAQRLAATTST